jgi:predicted heme/steroid binding protein
MTDRLYNLCSSLKWKLGIHLSEWQAARELAYRMGKAGDELNQAHFEGVLKLLCEHVTALEGDA